MKKLILGSLIAATLAGFSIPAAARTQVEFAVNLGPPPLRHEFVPVPRAGTGVGRYYRQGGWRDSDRDGIPNRYDRAPRNPYWR